MKTPSQIIDDLGGAAFVAAELSIPYTTVHHWVRKQTLPNWRCPGLLVLAERLAKPDTASAIVYHSSARNGTQPYQGRAA